jgi:hypothetical protein
MKKFITSIAILLFTLPLLAQESTNGSNLKTSPAKRNIIKTSLIAPLATVFDISYERMVSSELSIVVEVLLGEALFQVSPQLRYYLSENLIAPSGTFISPMVMIGSDISGAGLLVGRQMVFKDKISLDAYIGPALYTEGVAVWGGLNVGIAF